jgi:osmotically-inducible protein OsmY
MSRRVVGQFTLTALAVLALGMAGLVSEAGSPDSHTRRSVARALEQLPDYGAFDLLMFVVDRGTVTLEGYAHRTDLVAEAVAAVERVDGVLRVDNKVQPLPMSTQDDWIRRALFQRIYTSDFLSGYAATTHGHLALAEFQSAPRTTPTGRYRIHIVVKNGRVSLVGIVRSHTDRQEAVLRARSVIGTFAVENELIVSPE